MAHVAPRVRTPWRMACYHFYKRRRDGRLSQAVKGTSPEYAGTAF